MSCSASQPSRQASRYDRGVSRPIEPDLDSLFLPDSYGYRPGKSALDAVGATRQRCWKYDWILEFDIKELFDNFPHDLLLKPVRKHVACKRGSALHRKMAGSADGEERRSGRAHTPCLICV
nr:reverse transcriptase domain-containing protein [Mesorhizobium sp. M4A.F.Ca.ET.050.02.1.1]